MNFIICLLRLHMAATGYLDTASTIGNHSALYRKIYQPIKARKFNFDPNWTNLGFILAT